MLSEMFGNGKRLQDIGIYSLIFGLVLRLVVRWGDVGS